MIFLYGISLCCKSMALKASLAFYRKIPSIKCLQHECRGAGGHGADHEGCAITCEYRKNNNCTFLRKS